MPNKQQLKIFEHIMAYCLSLYQSNNEACFFFVSTCWMWSCHSVVHVNGKKNVKYNRIKHCLGNQCLRQNNSYI